MMRLLFVDDDPDVLDYVLDGIKDNGIDVKLTSASTFEDAMQLATFGYFHVAIVDLHLPSNSTAMVGLSSGDRGVELMRELREQQPACRIWLHSQYLQRSFQEMSGNRYVDDSAHKNIQVIGAPDAMLVDGIIPKAMSPDPFVIPLQAFSRAYAKKGPVLEFPDGIPERLIRNIPASRRGSQHLGQLLKESIEIEMGDLVRDICHLGASRFGAGWRSFQAWGGEGHDLSGEGADEADLRLQYLDGGLSGAVVLRGVIEDRGGGCSQWLVFKIDQRDRIESEVSSYQKHVRFLVSRSRRVELLGSSIGSRLGVLCYTFAHGAPSDVVSLLSLWGGNETQAERVLTSLFATKDLHSIRAKSVSPVKYMDNRFGERVTFHRAMHAAEAALEKFVKEFPGYSYRDGIVKNPAVKTDLRMPERGVIGVKLQTKIPAIVSHGDLHGGNVIAGRSGDDVLPEVLLIDYKDTGPAPRFLDFVILETSSRVDALQRTAKDRIVEEFRDTKRMVRIAIGHALTEVLRDRSDIVDMRSRIDDTEWRTSSSEIASQVEALSTWSKRSVKILSAGFQMAVEADLSSDVAGGSVILRDLVHEFAAMSFSWSLRLLCLDPRRFSEKDCFITTVWMIQMSELLRTRR